MAKFLAYYNLCPIHDTKEFLGLSKDQDDGNIITTLGRNIIIVIKLTNQKQIHSWTVLDKLSSKVVYNKKSNNYVGVFANKYVRCWDENVTDLNKVKRIKFYKYIVDLIEHEEIIVLYSDGTCESLSSAIDSRKEQNLTDSNQLHYNSVNNSKLFDLYDGRKMLTYFYKNDKTDMVELVTIYLDEINLKPLGVPKIYKLERRVQNVTLSGYTVVEGHQFPSLITIWSDKRIFLMSLDDNVSVKDVPGNILSMIDILNVNSPLSVHGISKHCVAIYGSNSGQEGASLILYNTQFKVVKAKQFFKIYFDFSRLWVIGSYILLAMGQNLSVVSFRVSKELLSEIIGSQASSADIQSYVVDDLINEEYELEDLLQYSTTSNNLREISNEKINEKLVSSNKIADGKVLPYQSYNDFHNNFNDLCSHNINFEILSSTIPNDKIKINLLSNFYDNGSFHLNEIEVIADELKKCGASEQEISEKLLTLLIKAEDNEDIAVCLRRYTNISEKILTKVLKYALIDFHVDLIDNCTTKQNGISSEQYENTTEINFISGEQENLDILLNKSCKINVKTKNDLINLILSCSFDTEGICRYIRKEIDLNEALILLKHLYNLIVTKENCLEEYNVGNCIEFDEDLKIFQWFGILLNTHFQKLALSRDLELIELLLKWNEIIIQYKNQLRDLEEFSAVLYNLVNQKQIYKENKSSKWYSIEEVKLF